MKAIRITYTSQEAHAAQTMLVALGIDEEAREAGEYDQFFAHAVVLARALSLMWAKRGYGDSWRETGYMGTVLKIRAKSSRLMNVLWWKEVPDDGMDVPVESPEDTFLDLVNYGAFGYEQWQAGEDRGVANRDL